jgi:pimeloyl-ACP methyl ester carboxylesterase
MDTLTSRPSPAPVTTGHVVSADGTAIGYRRTGHGPAVILLHGGLQSGQNLARLAEALSGSFDVIVPDRRPRGADPAAEPPSSSPPPPSPPTASTRRARSRTCARSSRRPGRAPSSD